MPRFKSDSVTVSDLRSGLTWYRDAAPAVWPMSWPEALAWIEEFNCAAPAGYRDWRLPNRREFFSLISHAQINPALPAGHPFDNVFHGYYWTATTVSRLPDQAWYVHLGGARVFKGLKGGSYMVWPVRGGDRPPVTLWRTGQQLCYAATGQVIDCHGTGQDGALQVGRGWPSPRFVAEAAMVRDRLSGLIWSRCADLAAGPVDWATAQRAIDAINAERRQGCADWRLPAIRELESLCDLQRHSPALPADHLFTAVQDFYWSATTSRYDPRYAWTLYLQDGNVGVGYKASVEFHVWAVRTPPPRPPL